MRTRACVASVLAFCLAIHIGVAFADAQAPDAERRARELVTMMAARNFAGVVTAFDARMRLALPAEKVQAGWDAVIQTAGEFVRQISVRSEVKGDLQAAIVTCEFVRNNVDVQTVFGAGGEVVGLSIRPAAAAQAYAPPSYAVPDRYAEEAVTAGAEGWPLPAMLTLPVGNDAVPAIVLVHGSGEQDLDASFGPNKVFRDLALGLASRGVAVLRYEKRSKEHRDRLSAVDGVTVKDEVIDDALAGVVLLRNHPRIDSARIFVLGMSLGGMLTPRLAAADPAIAGLIVMAGAVRPLERSIVEQTRYLLMADGQFSDDERVQLVFAEQLAARVRELTPADADKRESIGGAPASYWLDLRGYDPPTTAARLTQPFLILQGERDYQVTMADFGRWKAALDSRANVAFHSYPSLNHMFMAGAGPSLPSEYLIPGHVDAAVVSDIADWVASTPRAVGAPAALDSGRKP